MRWVKLTLPPRARARCRLMTVRLSCSSLAGTARTDVAVGTSRLAAMLATTRAAAPRSGLVGAPSGGGGPAGSGCDEGDGWAEGVALRSFTGALVASLLGSFSGVVGCGAAAAWPSLCWVAVGVVSE